MKINGKVHCFFEQSGTFKNDFIIGKYQEKISGLRIEFNDLDV